MNRFFLHTLAAIWLGPVAALAAPSSSAHYAIIAETADSGGGLAASATYRQQVSVGGIAGQGGAAELSLKQGLLGQLYEVTGLRLTAASPDVAEGGTVQLGAWQVLDDATFLTVNPIAVTWTLPASPIASIDPAGLATAETVFQDTPGMVEGSFGGFTASLELLVRNTIEDDFGAYAGDGIADDWQVRFFGFDNPDAAPEVDFSGSGQTNRFKFLADLDPLDPNSRFVVRLVASPPPTLVFQPLRAGRSYRVFFTENLLNPSWLPLVEAAVSDAGEVRQVTDLSGPRTQRFYRVEISRP